MTARRPSGADLLHLGLRGLLAAVFLWSGVAKALDRQGTVLAVDAYELFPDRAVEAVAAVLPWVEIGIGALLLVGLAVRPAAAGHLAASEFVYDDDFAVFHDVIHVFFVERVSAQPLVDVVNDLHMRGVV